MLWQSYQALPEGLCGMQGSRKILAYGSKGDQGMKVLQDLSTAFECCCLALLPPEAFERLCVLLACVHVCLACFVF